MTLRVLDLFSGIGGFSLGLERAGMRTVAFCEIEPYCRAVLRKHWPAVPIFEDVRDLHAFDVGPVDVICGGFPCQDISKAGAGRGLDGSRSSLWFEYLRLVGEIKPRWVVVENVPPVRSRGLERILGGLLEVGYDAEWHCIPASAICAPQARDRIWIVAYPKRQGVAGPLSGIASLEPGPWEWSGEKDLQAVADAPFVAGDRWPAPMLRRMDDGFPNRVDRLKCLGNSVVPQVVQAIGEAILEAETVCVR